MELEVDGSQLLVLRRGLGVVREVAGGTGTGGLWGCCVLARGRAHLLQGVVVILIVEDVVVIIVVLHGVGRMLTRLRPGVTRPGVSR